MAGAPASAGQDIAHLDQLGDQTRDLGRGKGRARLNLKSGVRSDANVVIAAGRRHGNLVPDIVEIGGTFGPRRFVREVGRGDQQHETVLGWIFIDSQIAVVVDTVLAVFIDAALGIVVDARC